MAWSFPVVESPFMHVPCFSVREQINPVWAPLFVKHYLPLLYSQQRDPNLSQMNEPRSSVITAYCWNQAAFERRGALSFGQLIKITRKRGSPIILALLKWGAHFSSFVSSRNLCLCQHNWSQMAKQSVLPGVLTEGGGSKRQSH